MAGQSFQRTKAGSSGNEQAGYGPASQPRNWEIIMGFFHAWILPSWRTET
jgi:hypothetical protein